MNNLLNQILSFPIAFAQTGERSSGIASETGDQIENLAGAIIKMIPLWITGGLVILLSFVVAKIVKTMVENKMAEKGLEEDHHEVQIVASRSASAVVLLLGITIGLKIAGIDLTSILAAAAFGVGFAMQDFIMNFLSGIIILLQKQFTIGDWVKVGNTTGVIQEIQSRSTVIKAFDGTKVVIPNSALFKNQVVSYTSNPTRRLKFNLGIDLYYDLKEVIDLIYKSIDKCDKILKKPKPSIVVTQPGNFYNNLQISCWVESRKGILKPQSALIRQIHKDFYARGWSWPYPTQTLIFDKDVPPDVNHRAREYMESHKKKPHPVLQSQVENPQMNPAPATPANVTVPVVPEQALKEEQGLIKQQEQILAEQNTQQVAPAVTPAPQIAVTAMPIVVPEIKPAEQGPAAVLPLPDVGNTTVVQNEPA